MLRPVWPGPHFWYCLGIFWSPSWVFLFAMEFVKKTTGLFSIFLLSALVLSWSVSNFMLSMFHFSLLRYALIDRFLRDNEIAANNTGYTVFFFGNVGLYYFSQKSVAYLLAFLSLAFYWFCTLLCIQPYTDFGALEILHSASLNQTLRLFGLRSSYSWLVIIVCIVISGIRYYCLKPVHPPRDATRDEIDPESGLTLASNRGLGPPGLTTATSPTSGTPDDQALITKARDGDIYLTRVPRESIVESTKSVHLEVTSESTGSGSSEVTTKPTEGIVPRDVTNSSIASAPSSNPPQLTPKPNASAPSPGLTVAASSLTSGTPDDQELTTKARDDAIHLNRAFAGWGCNEATLVKILAHRSARRRTLIRQEYKTKFSNDFDDRLSKELVLNPDLKRALLLWMDEPANRDAKLVKHGLSKNLNVAIEVICSRTPSQLEELKKAYRTLFSAYLDEDIESHAHGDNKKLLVAYAAKPHSESLEVEAVMVDKDAKDLFKDGQWRLGTNEETFIRIFSERSGVHLAAINSAYRKMYVNSLKKAVKKETSSKFKCALLTILKCAENPGKYFAKALHKAMAGLGTDDETLTRIIVTRAEVDIVKIKEEYLKKYRKPLSDDVHSDTSGHYRAFLLSLLNPNA